MWPEFVEYIGTRFTQEDYLYWSRIEGSLWTLADIVIAFCLIRMGNEARGFLGVRKHRLSYVLWLCTLPAAAFIPFVQSGMTFFRLELAVTIPHFLIILYICAVDARVGLRALRAALDQESAQRENSEGQHHETA